MSACDDEQPNLPDFSRTSTPTSNTSKSSISDVAHKCRKKLLDYYKGCPKCRSLYTTFPENHSDYSYYATKVKKHLKNDPHKNMKKRPATENASAEKPSKSRVDNPNREVPKVSLVINKDQRSREPSENEPIEVWNENRFNEQYREELEVWRALTKTHEAAGLPTPTDSEFECAKTLHESAKQNENILKNPLNEFAQPEGAYAMDIQQTEEQPFVTPRKTIDLASAIRNNSPNEGNNVETRNRYQPLQNQEEVQATSSTQERQTRPPEAPKKATATPKKNIPPPIVIVGADNGKLMSELDKVTSGNYWVKNTANSVIVHTQIIPDYDATIRALRDAKLHYHTYTTNGRKTHAFVLRGMAGHHTIEKIQEDMRNNTQVEVIKIFKMRTQGAPLFLVITNTDWNINKLNKEVPRVLKTAVQWENRRSNNPITQCRRCQTWGHSMGNCTRTIRCSKCAENHMITDCQHQGKPVCANCGGEHRSFSRNCPIYEAKLSQYLERFPDQSKKKPTYINAPPPVTPAWFASRPPQRQPGPSAATLDPRQYAANFPGAPGQRRAQTSTQAEPTAATVRPSQMTQLQALKGKWDEINSLINLDNMIKALDVYITMLRSARGAEELFAVSREFFCEILPTLNIAP